MNDQRDAGQRREMSADQIELKIQERAAKARQMRLRTYGGGFGGTMGAVFAFIALLKFESFFLSAMGFVVMGLGFAIVTPEDVLSGLRRNNK